MEDNFRNILIILSAIVITAIFIHGLWTIRKQKNPYKLKTSKDKLDPISRDFDRKGFDQDGVGQVKVSKKEDDDENFEIGDIGRTVTHESKLSQSHVIHQGDINPEFSGQEEQGSTQDKRTSSVEVLDSAIEDDWFKESKNSQFTKEELGDELTPSIDSKRDNQEAVISKPKEPIKIEPLYAQPVTQAKPVREPINKIKKTSAKKTTSKETLKRNQMEIDFDNQLGDKKTHSPLIAQENNEKRNAEVKQVITPIEPQVIILSVVMPANQQMLGAVLLPSLLTLGLKYGEMNIFHRHEDNAGNGKVTFSLANIMNPGSFDLDSMENFATRGVSLFMTLPNAGASLTVFEQMLNAAKQLSQEFNAQVIDENRNVMTKQTEQHYISKIREFERKSRIPA